MLTAVRFKARPNDEQKLILSQWMGCARFIWNAKCDEDRYFSTFARKFCAIGTFAPVDQKYSHFKDDALSPWLSQCPSQILRNSASNWYDTYRDFMSGRCGKPRRKSKDRGGSIHLTRELFRFESHGTGKIRLFIGTERNNIGYLDFIAHRPYQTPNSIFIKKRHGAYSVAFCYDDGLEAPLAFSPADHLKYLRDQDAGFLANHVVGIDRGVVRPVQAGAAAFDLTPAQKRHKANHERYIRQYQRRLARQSKGSRRRERTKVKLARTHESIANIRKDFCHKTSRTLVNQTEARVFVLEDLKTKQMTRRAAPRQDNNGKWLKNGAAAKSGLNRAVLDKGWHQFESFLKYKAERAGKAVFKISAHQTSQECAACGHTHPDNRISQASFHCGVCGHAANADLNAAEVIKKRAIRYILDSGSELSKKGVLFSDTGRGATVKSRAAKVSRARSDEASKNTRQKPAGFAVEAFPL